MGLPVNMVSHAHGQGYSDLHFVIPEIINYVDFDKGPYYANKGDFTTAGFVDFQTKNSLEKNFVKLEGGQFGTFRTVAGVNLFSPKIPGLCGYHRHQNISGQMDLLKVLKISTVLISLQKFPRV